jgi:hypothetical protein
MQEIKKFNFIKDEPTLPDKPGYFEFYHKSFSPALKEMILSNSCPHTIGLFGKWGTGKSSIINKLAQDLKIENDTKVLVFDAWKYQEDSLRRTFLIELKKFLEEHDYKVPKDILSTFYNGRRKSQSVSKEIPSDNESNKKCFWNKFWPVIFFLVIPFLLLALFYILADAYPQNNSILTIKNFFTYINTLAWLLALSTFFLKPLAEKFLDKITSKIFESTKTYTEIRTITEDEDRLNTPEQFENVFKDLISLVEKGKILIVFDNIDRVQGDIALNILSTIKTFLEVGKPRVVFLVPCDADAINNQVKLFYKIEEKDISNSSESEYLKKLFNVVVYTPEFIEDDLYEYLNVLIEQTGDDIIKIIKNEDVISVITKGFKNNPREFIQFINNLISAILVASKTEVADIILSRENIGYFTKVLVLKQRFSEAYKQLKVNWNKPENINVGGDNELQKFLTLTRSISTDDAEPFIYFKNSQIESTLNNPKGIRGSLISGDVEEFQNIILSETEKEKLIKYIIRLLKNYRSQDNILFLIFKTQIQGFFNLKETLNNTTAYIEEFLIALDIVWNNYLKLPTGAIFDFLSRLKKDDLTDILNRYILVLSAEEIKNSQNSGFLLNLIDEFIEHLDYFTKRQQLKIKEAIKINLNNRNDIILKFDTLDKQNFFVDLEIIQTIIQKNLTNNTLFLYEPIIKLYKDFIINNKIAILLLQQINRLMSLQNSETTTTTKEKIEFYGKLNNLFSIFENSIKELPIADQDEAIINLRNAYNQSAQNDDLQYLIATSLRWFEVLSLEQSIKDKTKESLNNFINQSSSDVFSKLFLYLGKKRSADFIIDHFDSFKTRSIQDDNILSLSYENITNEQKSLLIQYIIDNKADFGLAFLIKQKDVPFREKTIESLLNKSLGLELEKRMDIINYIKGKIIKDDNVNLRQLAKKQFYDFLKSDRIENVNFGTEMLKEPFLSDTDEREIVQEMLDFYNKRTTHLQLSDLSVISYFITLYPKLQNALKEKIIFLIFSNISSDRSFEIQDKLIDFIAVIKPSPSDYGRDYSDLVQRVTIWPEGEQKELIIKMLDEKINFSKISGFEKLSSPAK